MLILGIVIFSVTIDAMFILISLTMNSLPNEMLIVVMSYMNKQNNNNFAAALSNRFKVSCMRCQWCFEYLYKCMCKSNQNYCIECNLNIKIANKLCMTCLEHSIVHESHIFFSVDSKVEVVVIKNERFYRISDLNFFHPNEKFVKGLNEICQVCKNTLDTDLFRPYRRRLCFDCGFKTSEFENALTDSQRSELYYIKYYSYTHGKELKLYDVKRSNS